MLLNHGLLGAGEVVVLQPRRLAARMLARRVAEEVGTPLGEVVGYQIRLDSRISKATRIRFVTEGILLRQMSFDPTLRGISAIVFDEFHERHLYGDISLARCDPDPAVGASGPEAHCDVGHTRYRVAQGLSRALRSAHIARPDLPGEN